MCYFCRLDAWNYAFLDFWCGDAKKCTFLESGNKKMGVEKTTEVLR